MSIYTTLNRIINLSRLHYFLACRPYPFQQIRVTGRALLEVIDEISGRESQDFTLTPVLRHSRENGNPVKQEVARRATRYLTGLPLSWEWY